MVVMKNVSVGFLAVALFLVTAVTASSKEDDSVEPVTTAAPANVDSVKANQSLSEGNNTLKKKYSPHGLFKNHKRKRPYFRLGSYNPYRHRRPYKMRRPRRPRRQRRPRRHHLGYQPYTPHGQYMAYMPGSHRLTTPRLVYNPYKSSKPHNFYYKSHKPKENYTNKLLKFLSHAI